MQYDRHDHTLDAMRYMLAGLKRPPTRWQRIKNWCHAHPNLVACTASGALGVLWAGTWLYVICQ